MYELLLSHTWGCNSSCPSSSHILRINTSLLLCSYRQTILRRLALPRRTHITLFASHGRQLTPRFGHRLATESVLDLLPMSAQFLVHESLDLL